MEHILLNGADDRFVRLSVAYGLAEAGRPLGVNGLAQIFNESAVDGRGREMAFRALSSLNDERSLPFMRQVMAADVEPGFRLRAIQYQTVPRDPKDRLPLRDLAVTPHIASDTRDAAER